MSSNSLGHLFRITTFGESHGPAIGVVLDGVPPGLHLELERIRAELRRRAPGRPLEDVANSPLLVSSRQEPDSFELLSGLLDGVTTGAPLAGVIRNRDARPSDYAAISDVFRPGHAAFSWEARYGLFDARGGGRASGRETACRVLAGAIARQALELLLSPLLQVRAFVDAVGSVTLPGLTEVELLERLARYHPSGYPVGVACPDEATAQAMVAEVLAAQAEQDSVGGCVRCLVTGLPAGLGNPIYDKVNASLGQALLSIGAVRGLEFGQGFAAARLRGSQHNDPFGATPAGPRPTSNRAGGLLGGVTTGLPLDFRVAVKPTSSISQPQATVDRAGRPVELRLGGRHDPCIALRLPPVVEAMTCVVLLDLYLTGRGQGRWERRPEQEG